MKKHQFSFSNGEAKKRAKLDYKLLIRGEKITVNKCHFSRIEDNFLLKAVNFILSEDNCVSTSYGTKIVKLSEKENIQLPRFQHK